MCLFGQNWIHVFFIPAHNTRESDYKLACLQHAHDVTLSRTVNQAHASEQMGGVMEMVFNKITQTQHANTGDKLNTHTQWVRMGTCLLCFLGLCGCSLYFLGCRVCGCSARGEGEDECDEGEETVDTGIDVATGDRT